MLISPAFAQTAGNQAFGLEQMMPLILVFVVFYFLLIRPQQKRAKAQKLMLAGIKRGDRIITGGGIIGKVSKATDIELTVEVANDVAIHVTRDSVAGLYNDPASAPAPTQKSDGNSNDEEAKASGSKLRRLLGGK